MSHYQNVEEFQNLTGFTFGTLKADSPKDYRRLKARVKLIAEEFQELMSELGFDSVVDIMFNDGREHVDFVYCETRNGVAGTREGILKEMCDLAYVVEGTAVEMGFDYDEARKRVHESNLSKVSGAVEIDDNGKVIKPKSYQKPDLKDLV